MITWHEKIDVPRPVHEAFAYVRDFRNSPEWDATARTAVKLSPGPVATGSRFAVVCALPVGSVTLCYTVTHIEPDRSLELHGCCRLFDVTDTIHFSDTGSGTHIDYRARFNVKLPLGPFRNVFARSVERTGRASLQGLKHALEDQNPAPAYSGAPRFTRRSARHAKQHRQPMSAWMGDKHVVITGASSDLGLAAAQALAERGATLTLVLHDEDKASGVVNQLHRETGSNSVFVEVADLGLMSEVDLLVERLQRKDRPIDVLINNAGALFNLWGETPERIEQSFALLLLSPFRLTEGLFSLLARAPQSRVVNVVSDGIHAVPLQVDQLHSPREDYSGSTAYARTKRALMVLTEQWAEAWAEQGIVVNAMHAGSTNTGEAGADTMIWLAVATEAGKTSGNLFLDREPRGTHLRNSTANDERERARLQPFLRCFRAPPRHAAGRRASKD